MAIRVRSIKNTRGQAPCVITQAWPHVYVNCTRGQERCAWNTRIWTLGKHVLQIQVEVFHAVATTAENGEDCPYYLAVLIANKLAACPSKNFLLLRYL